MTWAQKCEKPLPRRSPLSEHTPVTSRGYSQPLGTTPTLYEDVDHAGAARCPCPGRHPCRRSRAPTTLSGTFKPRRYDSMNQGTRTLRVSSRSDSIHFRQFRLISCARSGRRQKILRSATLPSRSASGFGRYVQWHPRYCPAALLSAPGHFDFCHLAAGPYLWRVAIKHRTRWRQPAAMFTKLSMHRMRRKHAQQYYGLHD